MYVANGEISFGFNDAMSLQDGHAAVAHLIG